jgi:ATP-dependent Clp protease protease subunit
MNEGHIFIDGEVNEQMFQSVKSQVETNKNASRLIIHMSSPGGDVYQGYKIYHKLKSLNIPKDGIIEGECMSIATFIIMACDTIAALNPSRYMIHLPYMGMKGTSAELENGASELRMIEQEMINAYRDKTKLPDEQLKLMMEKETYMTAEEAKKFGFVDEVKKPLKAVAFGKREIMNNPNKNLLEAFGQRLAQMVGELIGSSPKAMDMPLKSGGNITISEDGKTATIEGNPAPAGEYITADGKVIIVQEGGAVQEIKPAPTQPPAEQKTPEQMQIAALQNELASIKASMAAAEAAKTQAEQAKSEAEARSEKTVQALKQLSDEFTELKKKTIGDEEPPKGAKAHAKRPSGEAEPDYWENETNLFLKENLPHLLNRTK